MQHSGHVDSVFVDLLVGEDAFDAFAPLSQSCDCAQEVAVSDPSLQDIAGVDRVPDKDWILDDIADPFPVHLLELFPQSERLLLSWKVRVCPHLIGLLIVLDQSFVVGLHDFFECVVLFAVFLVDVVDDVVEVVAFGVVGDVIDDL